MQKNEAIYYELRKLDKTRKILDIVKGSSFNELMNKRLKLRKPNDNYVWEIVSYEDGFKNPKILDSTDWYTKDNIRKQYKGPQSLKESMSTKQLLEAANRKCEMRWKVLAFNPAEDNKLVKEFKDFDCIDCAVAKKREYLEKNPTHIVEVISESKAQKNEAQRIQCIVKLKVKKSGMSTHYVPIEIIKDNTNFKPNFDPNELYKVIPEFSYALAYHNPGDTKLANLVNAWGSRYDWDYPKNESTQKNEEVTKSNYKSIINELESIFKKFAGNGLELGHKIKPNSFDLPFDTSLSVALKDKAKLEPVKAALKKVIDKYGAKKVAHDNDFAYNFGKSNRDGIYVGFNWNATSAFVGYAVNPDFDVKALSESSQKNEDLVKDKAYTVKKDFAFDYASEYSPSDLAKMKSSGYFYIKGDDLYVKKGAKAKYIGKDKSPQGIEFVSIQNFTVALPEDVLSRTSDFFESSQKNEATLKDGTKVKVVKGWYSGKTGTIAGTAEEYDPDTHRTTNYCYMVKIPGQGIIQIDRDNVVAESAQKNEDKLKYFTYTQNGLKTKADCDKALSNMKNALAEEPNFDAKKVIQRDMEIVKSWKSQKNEALDEKSLRDYLAKEHSRALKNIKNMAANDSSSFFKGYATALHEIQRKFGL